MTKITNIMLLQRVEQPILTIEQKTDMQNFSQLIGKGFEEISAYLKEIGELTTDIPFVEYPNYESMDEHNIQMRIGFHVSKSLPSKGDIKSSILPSQKIVTCVHRGTYEELATLYQEMAQWITDNGYQANGTAIEYYYTAPNVPENEHVTRVVMPLR